MLLSKPSKHREYIFFSTPFCSDFTTSYMFYDKASCFKRSECTLFQTFIKCKGEWKPITPFAWILESLPGNPLLWLTHFWEIRANLKLFNRVYIFPRKQSFQLLTKKKMFQPTINSKSARLNCQSGRRVVTTVTFLMIQR